MSKLCTSTKGLPPPRLIRKFDYRNEVWFRHKRLNSKKIVEIVQQFILVEIGNVGQESSWGIVFSEVTPADFPILAAIEIGKSSNLSSDVEVVKGSAKGFIIVVRMRRREVEMTSSPVLCLVCYCTAFELLLSEVIFSF